MRLTAKVAAFLVALMISAYSHAEVIRVAAEKVALRAEPSTSSQIVATVTKGTLLGVLETTGYWKKVKALKTGEIGYIHSALVDSAAAPSPVAVPTPAPENPVVSPPPAPERSQPEPTRTAPVSPAPVSAPSPSSPPPEPARSQGQVMESNSEKKSLAFTVWGGFQNRVLGTDLSFGGTLGFFPFANPAMEIEAGADYVDSAFGRVLDFSGTFNYNINLEGLPIMPYASGGLTYSRRSGGGNGSYLSDAYGGILDDVYRDVYDWDYNLAYAPGSNSGNSEIAFQLGGGVKFPIQDGRRFFRGDLRFIFYDAYTATRIYFGLTL